MLDVSHFVSVATLQPNVVRRLRSAMSLGGHSQYWRESTPRTKCQVHLHMRQRICTDASPSPRRAPGLPHPQPQLASQSQEDHAMGDH